MQSIVFYPVNILHIAYISVSILGILLVLGRPQYKALILLLALQATQALFNIFEELNVTRHIWLITPAMQMAYGPLYYLLVKNVLYGELNLRKHVIHFIPFGGALFFTLWWPAVLAAAFVVLLIYLYYTVKMLRHYQTSIAELSASDDPFAFNWLYRTFLVIGAIEICDFVRLNCQTVLSNQVNVTLYFISACVWFICLCYLLVKSVRQPELYTSFTEAEDIERCKLELEQDKNEYSEAQDIFSSIEAHVHQHHLYLQARFGLRELAEGMGLSEQLVSWAINQGGGKSFSNYINEKRIDALKLKMESANDGFNILQNAFDVGFSSKSSFNSVFKKHTGFTPTQYLKGKLNQ